MGVNTSRFQYLEEVATTTDGRNESSWYGFSEPEGPGVAGSGNFNRTFNNQTALGLLATANPSLPELRPSAADMTRRLSSLQARARTAAESIAAVSELVPLELRAQAGHQREGTPDASFAKRWVTFDFYTWWSGDDDMDSGYSFDTTRRAAEEVARLHDVVKAFDAAVTESVRRARAVESSLDMLEQQVTALAQVKAPKQGRAAVGASGFDGGAWAALGWRADCGCDSGIQTSPVNAVATTVFVAYFVPSVETLFQGMNKTFHLLRAKKASAIRRRKGAFEEEERRSDERWHEYDLKYGGATAVDEEGCLEIRGECLTLDEIGARIRSRIRDYFGPYLRAGIDSARGGAEVPLLDG